LVPGRDDWSEFWEERFNGPVPDVNFSEYFVIALFQGLKRTGGFGINVLETAREPGKSALYITLSTREPRADEAVDLGETSPYVIVRIRAPADLRQALGRNTVRVAFYRRAESALLPVDVAQLR
ncbi:MAG: protease complex subunit PrcB family protein, partial [Planctomycetota bacterium]